MKFYHGTSSDRAESIDQEGFMGGELSEMTDGFTNIEDGVVFLTDSIEEAKGYGDVVYEIEILNEEPVYFQDAPYSNAKEYYISAKALADDGFWNKIT